MSAEVIYLAKCHPETQVRLAAQSVGLLVKEFEGGFLLRMQDGEILPGHYALDENGVIDTYFGELMPWSAKDVLEYCAILEEGNRTGVYVV